MTEKWIINDDGEVEDTTTHMTFDSFWELLTVLNGQSRHLNQLSEENEQLKSVVKEVIELLSEEVDVFSDKATEHDLNAYIELKELDNKDAYYIATATKKAIQKLKELTR